MPKSKIASIALGVVGGAAVVAGTVTTLASKKNNAFLRSLNDRMMGKLQSRLTVTECDAGAFSTVKLFNVLRVPFRQFTIDGLGNLSTICMSAGPMQMLTFILTPFYKDVPLCSIDVVCVLGNRKTIVEFYDFNGDSSAERQEQQDSIAAVAPLYMDLAEEPVESTWSTKLLAVFSRKETTQKDDARLAEMIDAYLDAYLEQCATMPRLSAEETACKCKATRAFTDQLISEGGTSTDLFKTALGETTTRELFDTVMFGTQTCEA